MSLNLVDIESFVDLLTFSPIYDTICVYALVCTQTYTLSCNMFSFSFHTCAATKIEEQLYFNFVFTCKCSLANMLVSSKIFK